MSWIMIGVNFIGVCLLAGLCTLQWDHNSRLDQQVRTLEETRDSQAAKIADLDKTIKGNASDLEDLRGRLTKSDDTVKDDEKKLAAADVEKKRMQAQVDRDKEIVAQWRAAIDQRDQILLKQKDQLEKLVSDHNELVNKDNEVMAKYNDVANKYNALVQQLNNQAKNGRG